jgi:hypothetical protein
MDDHRTFANIARRVQGVEADGQEVQQFMSDSRLSGEGSHPPSPGGSGCHCRVTTRRRAHWRVIVLSDLASAQTAGAGRQHNGRLGKIEMSQVGTFLGFAKGTLWTWIDGELFLPEAWFGRAFGRFAPTAGGTRKPAVRHQNRAGVADDPTGAGPL